jgi:hypothetical protein
VSAWSRAFMSAAGPHPTTRLVLTGHRQFMKRDGSGCWAGVRRLAIVTGLDKSTVAKHRALAIGAGWLIVSARSPRSRFRTYLAAVPDAVPIPQTHRTRNSASIGLSEQTGQSSRPRRSGLIASTVRLERTHCPTPPDKTLVLTNKRTLAQRDATPTAANAAQPTDSRRTSGPSTAAEILRRWLQTDGAAERFKGSHDLLANLTPPEPRFHGHEDVIRERSTLQQQEPSDEGHQVQQPRRV